MEQTTNNISTISNTLSIQVSLNGLSFCTIDNNRQITAIVKDNFGIQLTPEQVLGKIKHIFDTTPTLKNNFKTVEVIYQNDLYTLVPNALFDPNILKEYLKYNIKVLENDFIAYDELNQHDMVTVYVPYTNINNFFFDTFGSFTYKHSSTILIGSLLSQEKNSDSVTVFANMNEKSFDLIVINKGKLILVNTFNHETREDFLYYLLFTVEQLKLNPENFGLIFLGDIQKDSRYFDLANRYIRNIDFGHHEQKYILAKDMKRIEPHHHFVLLSHF